MTTMMMRRLTVPALALGLLLGGCGGGEGEDGSEEGAAPDVVTDAPAGSVPGPGPSAAPTGLGPRALPPTFVDLEVDQFPRPADEACADNTRTVEVDDPSGLATAVREAAEGTTILVAPGTYRDDNDGDDRALVLDVPDVCLRAAEPVPGDPTEGNVVIEPEGDQATGIAVAAGGVVVDGVVVRGFVTGIGFEQGEGETLDGITIESVAVVEPTGEFREGIVSFGDNRERSGAPPALDGLLLLDVTVEGADLGVSCNAGPCAHWWLEGVSVTGRAGSEDSGADTFAIEEGRQVAVVDSRFAGAVGDGLDTKATDVVVYGVRVTDAARNGIKLWGGGDVIDSVVNGSGADAALVGEAPARYRYLHVLVTRHSPGEDAYVGTWGYDERQPVELEIVNSIFADNAPGGLFVPEGSTVSIRHTILDDPDAQLLDVGDGRTLYVADLPEAEAMGWAVGVLVADPLLVDPDGGDVATAEGSPARDAAEPVGGLDRDLLGGPRVVGAGPDIGPLEAPGG
jgi:hypothetical protein